MASVPTIDRDDEILEAGCVDPLPTTVPVRDAHFGGQLVGSRRPRYQRDFEIVQTGGGDRVQVKL